MTSAWLSGYARLHKTRRIRYEPESSTRCAQLAHKTALMLMSDQTFAQVYISDDLLINFLALPPHKSEVEGGTEWVLGFLEGHGRHPILARKVKQPVFAEGARTGPAEDTEAEQRPLSLRLQVKENKEPAYESSD